MYRSPKAFPAICGKSATKNWLAELKLNSMESMLPTTGLRTMRLILEGQIASHTMPMVCSSFIAKHTGEQAD